MPTRGTASNRGTQRPRPPARRSAADAARPSLSMMLVGTMVPNPRVTASTTAYAADTGRNGAITRSVDVSVACRGAAREQPSQRPGEDEHRLRPRRPRAKTVGADRGADAVAHVLRPSLNAITRDRSHDADVRSPLRRRRQDVEERDRFEEYPRRRDPESSGHDSTSAKLKTVFDTTPTRFSTPPRATVVRSESAASVGWLPLVARVASEPPTSARSRSPVERVPHVFGECPVRHLETIAKEGESLRGHPVV